MWSSSAPSNESSSLKCAKDVAWKPALKRPLSMHLSKNFKGLPNFHRNFAYAKFLCKGRSLKGHLTFCKIKLLHNFVQRKLPEGPPGLSPIKAHALALILQSVFHSQRVFLLSCELFRFSL